MAKILKEKIILNSNPFQFVTENAADQDGENETESDTGDTVTENGEKKRKPKAVPMHLKQPGNIYQVKYLERIVALCKKNAIEYIKMPNGVELKLHVIPSTAKLTKRVRCVSHKTDPKAKARAAHAREMRLKNLAKTKGERAKESDEPPLEDLSEDDILYWSSK